MTKTCTKCKEVKELSLFHKHANTADGLNEQCKACVKVRDRASYEKRIGRKVGKHKMFTEFETEPTRDDWLRLAAFVDGEGCIGVTRNKNLDFGRRSTAYGVTIMIANTNPILPNWCIKTFGGRIYTHPRKDELKHKSALCWHVSGRHAAAILQGMLPFLLLKSEQALNAIELQKVIGAGTNFKRLTVEDVQQRDFYYVRGKHLNRRGPDTPEPQIQ